nr:IS3 family transposase [uncultured Tyzzerella sp.]
MIKIFNKNYKSYGTRRIKVELEKLNIVVSRRKISIIMHKYNLVTKYVLKYRKYKNNKYNEDNNIVCNRKNKDSELVLKALKNIKYPINRIKILHIDRELEFKNSKLDKFMRIFNIKHSLI